MKKHKLEDAFMEYTRVDLGFAVRNLPHRPEKSNKGTFGKVFAYIGSGRYPGAMHLAAESLLRGGAGYVEVACEGELSQNLLSKFPELLFFATPKTESLTEAAEER